MLLDYSLPCLLSRAITNVQCTYSLTHSLTHLLTYLLACLGPFQQIDKFGRNLTSFNARHTSPYMCSSTVIGCTYTGLPVLSWYTDRHTDTDTMVFCNTDTEYRTNFWKYGNKRIPIMT